jgi:hydroxymethylpyrimidine/phosphomethylpyrimidine kinase
MIATSGDRLLDDEAVDAMRIELFGRALIVTPNIPEAEALTGISIATDSDRREAAQAIAGMGAATVLIKGGHFATSDISDLWFDGHAFHDFRSERVHGGSTHGTGCTFAAALVSHLALGRTPVEAIPLAQRYVAGAIRHAPGLGRGQGPIEHFWEMPPK